MKKGLKIALIGAGVVIGLPVLGFLGLMAYAVVQQVFFSLPTDGPRVVTTADYDFTAPEGWLTSCAHEEPACLAVAPDPNVPSWKQRTEWIEVHPVAADGVIDMDMLREHAKPVAYQLAQNRIDADLQEVGFRGEAPDVWVYTIVNNAPSHYWRTDFVRLAPDRILRFTCFGGDYTHDEACTRGLAAVKFTAAVKASFDRMEADWKKKEEEGKRAAQERAAAQQRAAAREAERIAAATAVTRVAAPAPGAPGVSAEAENLVKQGPKLLEGLVERFKKLEAKNRADFARQWQGPGWYVVETEGRAALRTTLLKPGRHDGELACVHAKPMDDPSRPLLYECRYFDAPP